MSYFKILWIFLFFVLLKPFALAQNVRSITQLENAFVSHYPDADEYLFFGDLNFEQSLMYRKRYNSSGKGTDSYYFNSLYFKDSIAGFKYLGYEFNLMHDPFEDSRILNVFRKWNIIRLGGALSVEYNPHNAFPDDYFDYLNANIYIRYFHIKKSARGDKTTKHTRGSWGFLANGEFKGRFSFDLQYKPFAYLWLHGRYKKDMVQNDQKYAFLFEFELNKYGYKKNRTESSKDIYNGLTLYFGPEINITHNSYSINLGLKMDFRNH